MAETIILTDGSEWTVKPLPANRQTVRLLRALQADNASDADTFEALLDVVAASLELSHSPESVKALIDNGNLDLRTLKRCAQICFADLAAGNDEVPPPEGERFLGKPAGVATSETDSVS
jgi:hypothetical protein